MTTAATPSVVAALRAPRVLEGFNIPQWEDLVGQARRTNLVSRLAYALRDTGMLSTVPAAPRSHLEAALVVAGAQAEAVRREVDLVRSALTPIDTDIVLLKGAAYLMAGLPISRGRVFTDIDILLPFDRLADAEAALHLHGWSTTHHDAYDQRYYRQWMHELPPLRHNVRMSVLDVHHAILPRTARLAPSSAKLLEAALPVAGEPRLRVLCPTDMVLHCATHLLHNEELSQGLRDLADLDSLLCRFGNSPGFWDALPRRAAELDLCRPLAYGVRYAVRYFGSSVPAAVRDAIGAGGASRATVRLMDALYDRALQPVGDHGAGPATSMARSALYLRGHWLRMPLPLLLFHLCIKATRRTPEA